MSRSRLGISISTAEHRYTLLDVFTDVPLAGNQLAVVHDADGIDDETMLAFARETKLAETTFVQSASADGADYRNRIFCMAGEMPFAGHPSLGTAVAVARARGVTGAIRYVQQTGAGLQPIDVELDGDRCDSAMLQAPTWFGPEVDSTPALRALGLSADDADPLLPAQLVATGLRFLLLPVVSSAAVSRIKPDPPAVDALIAEHETYGIYAAFCDPSADRARARMFGRSEQIIEDPATGSAAGPLCAYVHQRTGCESLELLQGVEIGRTSKLRASIAGDTVRVGGASVVVVDGVVRL